jgi:xylulokinase
LPTLNMATVGYLGLDIGGTGAKAGVYGRDGSQLGYGYARYSPTVTPVGHVEISIDVIHHAARDATKQAVSTSGAHIAAISLATQGQTFVVLDEDDLPLHPAILWYDSRASLEAAELQEAILAGRRPDTEMPFVQAISVAPKVMWLRRRFSQVMAHARRILLLPDYFNRCMTGEAVTDPCTASTTGLYIDGADDYDSDALAAAGIMRNALARIANPGAVIGRVLKDVAVDWGLSPGTLVITGTNDQYAGALGAGNCRVGILSETTGTCLALVTLYTLPGGGLVESPGLLRGRFPIPGFGFVLAYAKTAGLMVDWFQQSFARGSSLAELEARAMLAPIGSNGLTVLPHFDGMVSPVPNAASRGAMLNLGLNHTQGDMFRAVLESIAFSLRENIGCMQANGLDLATVRSIGGGAKSDLWMQIKADVTGMQLERPRITESATLGAAMLAAVGAGEYATAAECNTAFYRAGRLFSPDQRRHELYTQPYEQYRGLYQNRYGVGG